MKALSDVTVIELSNLISAAHCTMMMGDLGADVIKVEQLGVGDAVRNNTPKINGIAPVFTAYNRNKKSIALDLEQPESIEIIKKLLSKVDILVDSYPPDTMEKMGLDYDSLKNVYPELICVSLTGFGNEGPYKNRPVYDGTLQAESGMTKSLIDDSDGTPYLVGGNIAQYFGACFSLVAVLGALHQRHTTKQGQKVEMNLYGGLPATFYLPFNDYVFNNVEKFVDGHAPQGFTRSKDGWLRITCGDQHIWERAKNLFDDPVLNETRFDDPAMRDKYRELLLERVEMWTQQYTSNEVVRLFAESGIPGGVVRTIKDLHNDPHLKARNQIVKIDVPGLGNLPFFASPLRLENSPVEYRRAPGLGEHGKEILSAYLGFTDEEISGLRENRILGGIL